MNYADALKHVNDDPELRRIAYESARRARAERVAREASLPPRRPDREILIEMVAVGREIDALRAGLVPRGADEGRAHFQRIIDLDRRHHELKRELHGLKS